MRAVVFYSSMNKPGINPNTGAPWQDSTGAFAPEAKAFAGLHGVEEDDLVPVDCTAKPAKRRQIVLDKLDAEFASDRSLIDLVLFSCHGWNAGVQFGFDRSNAAILAKAMRMACADDVKMTLFCCWTADADGVADQSEVGPATDGGFADVLRDRMMLAGFAGGWIDAHKVQGHCSRNPFLVRFPIDPDLDTDHDFDLPGGHWLVQPRSGLWRAWIKALQTDFRYRFPLMTDLEVAAVLQLPA